MWNIQYIFENHLEIKQTHLNLDKKQHNTTLYSASVTLRHILHIPGQVTWQARDRGNTGIVMLIWECLLVTGTSDDFFHLASD